MNRRHFLSTIGGLSTTSLLQAQYRINAKAKNVIFIWLGGGIAAQETWDAKSGDPDYVGPFSPISTKTEDLFFSDRFPLMAKQTDKFSVIRSMTHGQAAHERGTEYQFTGYKPSASLKYPSVGSIISHELGARKNLPPYITVPNTQNEFANSGFLSSQYSPFGLGSDPASPNFQVRDLSNKVSESRRKLLEIANSHWQPKDDQVIAMDKFYQQAFGLMNSPHAQDAFNLDKEPQAIKDAYGVSQAGARLLMARRLVESGVRIVKVNYGGWDNHDNIRGSFERQAPQLDKALSALFKDLQQRGMLDETLVIVTSEFGRTPKINKTAGRDHYPKVFSTIVGGGGIQNGRVYGASTMIGDGVDEDAVSPEDLFATVFRLVGINSDKQLMTSDKRPVSISRGNIIKELV